jgi:hypothetical protein
MTDYSVPAPANSHPQGIVGCGVSFVLLTWCIEKRGPVFVAAFIPVVQIIVSVIDFWILHEQLYLGRYCTEAACLSVQHSGSELRSSQPCDVCSVLGSVLVIGGLYLLLWGKRQEALHCPPKDTTEDDKEQQQPQAQD